MTTKIKSGLGYKILHWETQKKEKSVGHSATFTEADVHVEFATPGSADAFLMMVAKALEHFND